MPKLSNHNVESCLPFIVLSRPLKAKSNKSLPFLLTASPLIRSPTATPRKGIVQLQDPTGAIAWYNNSSLRPPQPQQRPSLGPGPLLSPRGGQKIRENAADNDIGGPIYEDIDRMCSYRGYPPPGKDTKNKVDPYATFYRGFPHYADFGTSKKLCYTKFALVEL